MPPATITPDALPQSLIEAFAQGNCVLCTGSGVGTLAGEPSQLKILEKILRWAKTRHLISSKNASTYQYGLKSTEWKTTANSLIRNLKGQQPALHDLLCKTYDPPGILPADLARLLKKLPFAAALTTSHSPLLENVLGTPATQIFTSKDCKHMEALLLKREFFIFKLHGSLLQPDSLLLSPDQFSEAVHCTPSLPPFMETLLSTRTVLFIGASLESIVEHLVHISLKNPTEPRHHFALLPTEGEQWMHKAEWLEQRYGIHVLPYSARSGPRELQAFFERLDERLAQEATRTSKPAAQARSTPALQHIKVENIGPVDTLEFKLPTSFTVVLSNEAVGKTMLLQAIAAGLCGQKVLPCAVGHLVKMTKSSATIRLESGKDSYPLLIRRMSTLGHTITINGSEVPPLEAEHWLALGFSAIPTDHATFRKAGAEKMPWADQLPLLTGTSETQLAQFKRWLIALTTAGGSQHLVKEIFRLFAQLLEIPSLRLGDVNAHTLDVTVINDDGLLSLEALGQGATSLIVWVGLLMKHLHELPAKAGPPLSFRHRPALVLIDDIDGFLGPLCLQKLVLNLRGIFPNVQFIASARNDVITFGLASDEVIHLVRATTPDGKPTVRRQPYAPRALPVEDLSSSHSPSSSPLAQLPEQKPAQAEPPAEDPAGLRAEKKTASNGTKQPPPPPRRKGRKRGKWGKQN